MDPEPVDDEAEDTAVDPEADAEDEAVEELDPREAARLRRRDHDAAAHERDLMRPGMGKVFKQITDAWSQERPAKKRGHHQHH